MVGLVVGGMAVAPSLTRHLPTLHWADLALPPAPTGWLSKMQNPYLTPRLLTWHWADLALGRPGSAPCARWLSVASSQAQQAAPTLPSRVGC